MRANPSLALFALTVLVAGCRAPSREASPEAENDSRKPAASDAEPSGSEGSPPASETKPAGTVGRLLEGLKPDPVVIPAGTTLTLALESPLSSATSRAGDTVLATLVSEVTAGDKVALPAGSEVRGRVTAAVGSGRVKGRARLAFAFDRAVVKGKEHALTAQAVDITAGDSHKRDAAIAGGAAAAGGIIGAIAGGKGGAGKGLLIGGAAGAGTVLATKGKEVALPAGRQLQVTLSEDLVLD
jgi:hypothetical protein